LTYLLGTLLKIKCICKWFTTIKCYIHTPQSWGPNCCTMEASLAVWYEKVQRRATKYILQDYKYVSEYKQRLIQLRFLPIMYMTDIMYFIKSLKFPNPKFNILDYVQFTLGSAVSKLEHLQDPTNCVMNFYFFVYLNSGLVYRLLIYLNPLQWSTSN